MRILLLEDETVNRLSHTELLSRFGQCHAVVNGTEGVAAFRQALEAGEPYDLVVTDIQMPQMDGHQAVALFRELEDEFADAPTAMQRTPIIFVSGMADDRSKGRAFFEGLAVSYVEKPLTEERIAEELVSLGLSGNVHRPSGAR